MLLTLENRVRGPEIAYAIQALLQSDGLKVASDEEAGAKGVVRLHYGRGAPRGPEPCLWILASTFFEEDYGTPRSLPRLPPGRLEGHPLLFAAPGEEPMLRRLGGRVEITGDLVASTFFLLSGYEETVRPEGDAHGRFLAAHSSLAPSGLLESPLVDGYAAFLGILLRELAGAPTVREDPPAFAFVLSHDVDSVRPPRRMASGEGSWERGLRAPTIVDPVLEIEARHGVRSTFFFMAGGEDPVKPRYDLGDPRARMALRAALEAGAEIGLHGSYYCLERPGLLESEAESLRREVPGLMGYRQHYLRLPPGALARMERAGFGYDSSLGWPDALGFRNGTARPFHPFDFEGRRPLSLVEIPLVAMDRTLQKYLGLTPEAAWEALLPVLEEVRRARGCAAILWHPEFFDGARHPGFEGLYERVLRWLQASGGRALVGREAVRLWRDPTRSRQRDPLTAP